jgi:hypothetical protein
MSTKDCCYSEVCSRVSDRRTPPPKRSLSGTSSGFQMITIGRATRPDRPLVTTVIPSVRQITEAGCTTRQARRWTLLRSERILRFRKGGVRELEMGSSERLMVERRRETRIQVELPVRIWGFTAQHVQFVQDAIARNISASGALLSGIDHELRSGDLIGIQYGEKRARFKVVWVRDSGTRHKTQAAVHRMEGEECPWEQDLPQTIAVNL